MESSLAKIAQAEQALIEAQDLTDILAIRDFAKAAVELAKAQKRSLIVANKAKEIQLRAERKAGEFLAEMPKAVPSGSNQYGEVERLHDATVPPTYAEMGIEKTEAHRWQTMAKLPEGEFEDYVKKTLEDERELTSAAVRRLAKTVINEERREAAKGIDPPVGKYRVIYADPPWMYQEQGETGVSMSDNYGNVRKHYSDMTIDELCAMPVKDIAEENAVLFIWVTSPMLKKVWPIIEAWGFEYKSSFVWDKVKHNFGYYNSVRHEFLLICGRGKSTPEVNKLFDSVQTIERTEHSVKPGEFRTIIDTLYPGGKRIELFAREKTDNWDIWGSEA